MFLLVASQILILFILIALGFILAKTKVLNEIGIKNITDFVLLLVTPCVIIKSFVREFDPKTLTNLLISLGATLLAHIIFIMASFALRSKDISKQKVLQFSVIFSNCGFMAIPLQQALLSDDGVFYGSAYIALFNVVLWSYGLNLMSGDKKSISVKKLILSPGIIGFIISLVIFFFSIPLPKIIYEPISYIAALNTPLPMIIIGFHLANSDFLKGLKDFNSVLALVLRLFILPLIVLFVMYLCGIRDVLLVSLTICSCAPTAAMTTMFASKYNRDTELSVSLVSISTIFSLISMPLIITLAQLLAK